MAVILQASSTKPDKTALGGLCFELQFKAIEFPHSTSSRLPQWNPGEMLLPGGITWERKDRLHKETGLEVPQRGKIPYELRLLELSSLMPGGK